MLFHMKNGCARADRGDRRGWESIPATAKPPALAGGFWLFRCAMEASYVICAAGFSFHAVSVVGLFALNDPGDRGEAVPCAALCGIVLTLRKMEADAITIGGMMFELGELDTLPVVFDEKLWHGTIDHVTVHADERVVFRFKDGKEITTRL